MVQPQPLDANDKCLMDSDEFWSPACMHMSDDEYSSMARGQAFLEELSDVESVPDFLGDAKIHAWIDGSEIRGQAGFGVYFPHGEFPNVSQPVVGAQMNIGVEVLAVRAAMQRVLDSQELSLYSDSKWCVDIFSNLHMYKRKPLRHHDVWEDIYHIY